MNTKDDSNILNLLRRAIEMARPNLRDQYRIVRKAKVVKTYDSDGQYWCDVQPLLNDDSVDAAEPVVTQVEIPILWGGEKRGLVCPPAVGTLCDLSYYDGDPAYPRVSNFRWERNVAPECEIGALIIQKEPGVHIKIDAEKNIIHVTPQNRQNDIGMNKEQTIGGDKTDEVGGVWTIHVTGAATVKSDDRITLQAPLIGIEGNMTVGGSGGGCSLADSCYDWDHKGDIRQDGNHEMTGDLTVNDIYVGTVYYGALVPKGN